MPYQANDLLFSHFRDNNIDLSNIDAQLQLVAPDSPNLPLYRDMMLTILRMAHDDSDRWSAKITLQALRELDQSFRTLQRYKGRRKVTVFGSARTPLEHPMYALARELGATLARADLMVITGAGGGIMAAAHEGAGSDHSLGLTSLCPSSNTPTRPWMAPTSCCPSISFLSASCSSSKRLTAWCYARAVSAHWMKRSKY